MSTPLVIKCGHLADEVSALPSLPCPRVTPEHPARPPPSASQAPTQHCTSSHRAPTGGPLGGPCAPASSPRLTSTTSAPLRVCLWPRTWQPPARVTRCTGTESGKTSPQALQVEP